MNTSMAPQNAPRSLNRHPAWCDKKIHAAALDEALANVVDDAITPPLMPPPHERFIADGWMPEIRRCDDRPPTRSAQPGWAVTLKQVEHYCANGGTDYMEDEVVVLAAGDDEEGALWLLPGEARELAAALVRAADVLSFSLGDQPS